MHTARSKILFATLCTAFVMLFIQNIAMTVMAPDVMVSLRLSPDQMGVLGGAYLYAYACAQFCSGMLAARFGPRRILSLFFVIAAAGGLLFAGTEDYGCALAGRGMTGLGTAVVMACSVTLFSRWYPPESHATITAWFYSIGGLGSYIGTAPFSWLNAQVGWRNAYAVVALAALGISIAVWCVVRDWPPDGDPHYAPQSHRVMTLREIGSNLALISKNRDFWRLVAWCATMSAMFYTFAGLWGGVYLQAVYGLSHTQAGAILSLGALGFIVGNPLLAWLCRNVFRSYRAGMAISGPLGAVAACGLVFYTGDMSPPVLSALVLVLCLAANAPNAILFTSARILFGGRMLGSVGGIFGFSTFLSGGFLQILTGYLLKHAETAGLTPAAAYSRAFIPLLVCCLVCSVVCFRVTETYGKAENEI